MLQLIKKLFYNNQQPQASIEVEDCHVSNTSITFEFDDNTAIEKKIAIKILLNNLDQIAAKRFGDLLFHINEGYYAQSIIEILNDIGSKGPEEFKCVQKIIKNWGNKIIEVEQEEQLANNEPIIAPSLFGHTTDNNN